MTKKEPVPFPSTTRSYDAVGEMEKRPLTDDLLALAELHDLGSRHGGWSNTDVVRFLMCSLHALYNISPEIQHQRANPGVNWDAH